MSLPQIQLAIDLVQSRMGEVWSIDLLASAVALSRAHLTRLFTMQAGWLPMRLLVGILLTDFTRHIEETEASVPAASAAHDERSPSRRSAVHVRSKTAAPMSAPTRPMKSVADSGCAAELGNTGVDLTVQDELEQSLLTCEPPDDIEGWLSPAASAIIRVLTLS